jgi:catechol 2,3-dioxygenase-like lactoylglutathione lyase family enzyme
MLPNSNVTTRILQDLERARSFYSSKLGLEPVEQQPGASAITAAAAIRRAAGRAGCPAATRPGASLGRTR